jgi:pimeloyl-ACP methyl ester carboxylesterase
VTDHFSRHWGLDDAGRRAFEHRLERIGGRPLDCFSAAKLLPASGCRGLVVHAPNDADVPFRCAQEIAPDVPGLELNAFDGLGHRNILYAPQVARTITSYLKGTVKAPDFRVRQTDGANAPSASAQA